MVITITDPASRISHISDYMYVYLTKNRSMKIKKKNQFVEKYWVIYTASAQPSLLIKVKWTNNNFRDIVKCVLFAEHVTMHNIYVTHEIDCDQYWYDAFEIIYK